ncbi:MAG: MBL fold metallo-hydrolase [Caldilinea sp.]|nr:MBL fold metallo-hydrolase [Caldilinea sp.]MCB9119776.1 MBL fold metallo-hydrolase [Caldilineaceae bacterium]MCO5211429.1 MBL fold metallo-hydrolase [Caldilinea sp.]MCW5842845.1 MBL fold metallo-hydrolase [Caldilinea sp.]HRW46569.1 MBL fold metallo-hydrolase [Caldilinea sp.]
MLLRYFYDEKLAQASYLVGCVATGEALVVDPARNVIPYLREAEKEGLRITHVTETHIHADFVSGSRELAAATGATIYLSDMGDANWKYAYADDPNVILVRDGDSWKVGNIKVEVLHTPGHTPEHIAFMITDTAGADKPMGVFTGDFLFVGDVGRPDLLEEAAGYKGTKEVGARQQFQTVERFKALPDYLQIWPGHGAGSACGKALGAIPSTTLGYEKLFNPAFQFGQESAFVAWLLDGQPEPPKYFAQMKKINKLGPPLINTLPTPMNFDRRTLDDVIEDGGQIFDLRNRGQFISNHVPGTINVPSDNNSFVTYMGWLVDYDRPVYVLLPSIDDERAILRDLRSIGIDYVPGYFSPEVLTHRTQALPVITAKELARRLPQNGITIVDVRGKAEYAEKHIVGARLIPLGYLPDNLDSLDKDGTIVTHCASGYRSQIAASLLQAAGFENVLTLNEGTECWSKFLPTESGVVLERVVA